MKRLGMYWKYATRSLLRGGQRTLLAIFCVAVGVMAIVALQLVTNAITGALLDNVRQINGGDVQIASQNTPLTAVDLAYFDGLKTQGALTTYTAVDMRRGQATPRGGSVAQRFNLGAVDPMSYPIEGMPIFTVPARASLRSTLQGNSVVLNTTLAQILNVHVGDSVRFTADDGRTAIVTVGGVIQSSGSFVGAIMLIDIHAYAAIPAAGQPVTYDVIYADVPGHGDAPASAIARQIQDRFPLSSTTTTKQSLDEYKQQVDQIRAFLQIVGLLALLIGGVGIANTMQVTLRRRRIEIAMLKTSGYRQRDLSALFALEAGLIGLIGGLIGSAVGLGVSFLVKGLVEQVFHIILPASIDPQTLGAGVAIGFVTALIFGLLPIVRSSQVRPLVVLRELPERIRVKSRLLTGMLLAIVAALFFALAYSILQNLLVAVGAVGGAGVLLGVLGLLFAGVVTLVSRIPVPETFRWWHILPLALALTACIALAFAQPAFGVLLAVVAFLGVVTVLLPRPWKSNVKLALRNIGRQKTRSVTTLIALFVGVFAIGLVLTLGQDIKAYADQFYSRYSIDAALVVPAADRAAVERQIAQTPGVTHETLNTISTAVPTAINGEPIGAFIRSVTAGGRYRAGDVVTLLAGVQGYDLAGSHVPDPQNFPLQRGVHDTRIGRRLTASDAGTSNALLPIWASQAPLDLKLGDTVTLSDATGKAQVTITIVGFYKSAVAFEPVLLDTSTVETLAGGAPLYAYSMYLDPHSADVTLAHMQDAIPAARTYSLASTLAQAGAIINNLVTLLVAIASLAMLASIIIIANSVALAMLERRRELGILKAVGHTSRSVLGEVLIENGAVGFMGGLLAMLLVATVTPLLGQIVFADASSGGASAFGTPAPVVLGIVPATALACMLVAAGVAWRATRVRPLEVLRYE